MNYFQFTKRFPTENAAIDYIVEKKYQDGYYCPKCGCYHNRIYHLSYDRRKLYCNNCKSEFFALTGTIFENTHLDIRMVALCNKSRYHSEERYISVAIAEGTRHRVI